jgi:hypothetical protein
VSIYTRPPVVLRDVGSRGRGRRQARPGRARRGALRRPHVKRELPLYTAQLKEAAEAARKWEQRHPKAAPETAVFGGRCSCNPHFIDKQSRNQKPAWENGVMGRFKWPAFNCLDRTPFQVL